MVNRKIQRFVLAALIMILASQGMFASGNKEVADEYGSEVSAELDRIISSVESGDLDSDDVQGELQILRDMYVEDDLEEFLQLEELITAVAAGTMNAEEARRQ